jgi:hypothetical protein
MIKLFGIDIAKEVNDALGKEILPAVLHVRTFGARLAPPATGQAITTTTYACKGFIEDFDLRLMKGTLVEEGDRKAVILGGSLPDGIVPRTKDQVTIEGHQYNVIHVGRDPAGAVYTMVVRG